MKRNRCLASLILTMFCCLGFVIHAEKFEGKLQVVTFNNMDKKTEGFSSGIGYNGATELEIIVKGDKVLVKNKSLFYSTLYDPESGFVYYWSEKLGEGISIDYKKYCEMFQVFTKKDRRFLFTVIPGYTYNLSVVTDKIKSFGYPATFLSGRIENNFAGVDVDLELIPSMSIPLGLNMTLTYGMDIEGFVSKFRWTMDNRVALVGQFKGYQGIDVKSMDMSYQPTEEDFKIPDSVKIKKKGTKDLHGYCKKLGKYLRKNNLFPDQTNSEVIYELNEDEWSY